MRQWKLAPWMVLVVPSSQPKITGWAKFPEPSDHSSQHWQKQWWDSCHSTFGETCSWYARFLKVLCHFEWMPAEFGAFVQAWVHSGALAQKTVPERWASTGSTEDHGAEQCTQSTSQGDTLSETPTEGVPSPTEGALSLTEGALSPT